jgi:hypothetical protein
MSKLLSWHATHQNLSQGKPYSAVATIISTESRNIRHTPLIPPHVAALQAAGVAVRTRSTSFMRPAIQTR